MDNSERLKKIIDPLLWWYDENRRILPWREEPTPYRVWVSEIMLQQTRVEAGKGYFERFVSELPDIESLANVEDQRLMKLWEGLGYYNRARNLKKAAGIIMEQYSGRMPNTIEGLLSLPGIGSYTAGAIGSIAFGLPVAAVDGNVLRVMARLECDDRDILSVAVKKDREKALSSVMPTDRPGDFNQALMELGAMVCLPKGEPRCSACPVVSFCEAHSQDKMFQLPVKKSKKERKIEERTVILLLSEGKLALRKRPEQGLLRGMWEIPSLPQWMEQEEIPEALDTFDMDKIEEVTFAGEAKHIFSHIEWRMKGYFVKLSERILQLPQLGEGELYWVTPEQLEHEVAIPTAFKKYIQAFLNTN